MSIDEKTRNHIARVWTGKANDIVRSGRVPTADEEMEIIIEAYEAAKSKDQSIASERRPIAGYIDSGGKCVTTHWSEADTHQPDEAWEYFCDRSYYDQWAVRLKGETRWGHCFHVPSVNEARELAKVLNARPMRESGIGWTIYPLAMPTVEQNIRVSMPLLFVTEEDQTHIRLGYFSEKDGAFYESGDPHKYPYTSSTVTTFYEFPMPKLQKTTDIEDGDTK